MTKSLTEKSLRFDFDDDWKLCGTWDGTSASKYEIVQGKTPACVDLVAIDSTGSVYLIEVKDHAKHPRENEKPLPDVLRDKVHDTVMGVITETRRGDKTMLSTPLAHALVKGARVRVVLHLEEPTGQVLATRRQRMALNGSLLMKQHENAFKWLKARLLVVNRYNCETSIPGLAVHRLQSTVDSSPPPRTPVKRPRKP
ncbi:hypothetical protein ACSRUE_31545 [Sorangium sp. KYC3313]|uniref:hypothetical protein n=1 Tax=Sorangium sp. KYC3313 TaxID=3449740 RepID=UPI003F8B3E8D